MLKNIFAISCICFLGFASASAPMAAFAQAHSTNRNTAKREGIPGRRVGAGTRGDCRAVFASTGKAQTKEKKPLMAFIPEDILARTVSESPTLYWYVPDTDVTLAELRLVDEQDRALYEVKIPLTGKAGIVSHQIPASVASRLLKPNQPYEWLFSLLCDQKEPSGNPYVRGVLQRIPPSASLISQLRNAQPSEHSAIYARAGIWQDALSESIQQRCRRPNDQSAYRQWVSLLQSVNLAQYSTEPVTSLCHARQAR